MLTNNKSVLKLFDAGAKACADDEDSSFEAKAGNVSSNDEGELGDVVEEPPLEYVIANAGRKKAEDGENSPGASTTLSGTTTLKNGKFSKYICTDATQFAPSNAVDSKTRTYFVHVIISV
jgi:hypothetical protein